MHVYYDYYRQNATEVTDLIGLVILSYMDAFLKSVPLKKLDGIQYNLCTIFVFTTYS